MKKNSTNTLKRPMIERAENNPSPEKDVVREPGQIGFKDALKKAILPGKKKK